jgi:hypothetical protein
MHSLPNLTPSIAREVFAKLCASLAPPRADTPETRAARDELAMAAVAALHPTDALDAMLAVDIVLAEACYADAVRQAGEYRDDLAVTNRCRAQAAAMLRQMRGLLRDYEGRQAKRDKALAAMHPAAMERAGYWFRDVSVPLSEPAPAQAEAAPPIPAPTKPEFSELTEAEQYALLHPARTRRIRAAGGLPTPCDFGPPEPAIVDQLVHGTSPILLALDHSELATAAT